MVISYRSSGHTFSSLLAFIITPSPPRILEFLNRYSHKHLSLVPLIHIHTYRLLLLLRYISLHSMSFRLPRSLPICSSMFPSAARARLPPTHYARSFFSLPDLSPLLGNKSPSDPNQEQHYREEKVFPYTPEQLYTVVAHIPSYKSFIPFCTSSRIVSGSPGVGDEPFEIEAELKVGFMGFEEGYVSKVKGIPFESVQAIASETPLFKTLVTTWTFHPPARLAHQRASPSTLPSSQMSPTMVTLDLRYSFNNPSHATASSMFFGGVSEMMVNAFEKRCRDLYGPR